ncbi:MAG: hypothetical protein KGL46_06840 [Hyphomicrobiales bacterium]|nr:hypothetical protein [Hyphomicrobiales bacterium]
MLGRSISFALAIFFASPVAAGERIHLNAGALAALVEVNAQARRVSPACACSQNLALRQRSLLVARGVPAAAMRTQMQQGRMILIVRTDKGDLAMTEKMGPANASPARYRMQAAPKALARR